MNYEKNIRILNDFEKVLGNGQPVNFQIKNSDGELTKVSKEEFANWMTEGKEEKNVKNSSEERLVYGITWDIDGSTYFIERKGKDGVIKESYYQPRSEEEKKQIIERNKKRREEEKFQEKNFSGEQEKINKEVKTETSSSYDEKDQKLETNTSSNNKGSSAGTVVAASGILVIVGTGLYYWIKPKKIKK